MPPALLSRGEASRYWRSDGVTDWHGPEEWRAVALSLRVSFWSTLVSLPLGVFLTVTLPMTLLGILILAGAIRAFAKAMGEFGASITFVANNSGETRAIRSAIYAFLQVPGGETAATRLVIVSAVVAVVALLASEVIGRRFAARVGVA